jgi:2-oxoglutarate dehydrogenase E2 component (dihydrolipoamide succinyltransferase)
MPEIKVIMPQMGESIIEGTITKWLKQVGDPVTRDEPLFEISTDKIDSEIPAPSSGVLSKILHGEDETVEINTVVALIESSGADAPSDTSAGEPAASPPSTSRKPSPVQHREAEDTAGNVALSPMVRRLAREHDIDLRNLSGKGTGAGGRITKRDIMSHIEQMEEEKTAALSPKSTGPDERIRMSPMRRSIAEHMLRSRKTSAHVATVFEADCSAIMAARETLGPEFSDKGVKLTLTPFFVKAVAESLLQFPILNASVEGDEIVLHSGIHVGIAVAIEDGLLVPVIRHADRKPLRDLARIIPDFSTRARDRKLTPEEVQGGTFTLTNPGIFGGLYGIPIVNQPQVAILATGGIEKRPVVIGDAIAIRPMVYLALSFDHRIIDGAVADQFMSDLKKRLEGWEL